MFWSGHVGAAAGCRCTVLLQGAAVKVVCALWSWPACRCRVLLQGAGGLALQGAGGLRMLLEGAAV